MIRARLALVLCASMIAACAGTGSDGGADGSVPDADPRSGVWSYHDGGITQTDCDSTESLYTDPDTQFVLTNNGDGSFTIEQGEQGDFDCEVDGDDFECPQRLYDELSVQGYDAVVSWQVSVSGTFDGNDAMEGEQIADLACTGSDCTLAEVAVMTSLPCSYTVAFTADYSG